jgi:hypothetical protein
VLPAESSSSQIQEIDVLWINAGLSCDGDRIAMTAATQPSIEDLVLGNLPWIPKVNPRIQEVQASVYHVLRETLEVLSSA